jgi:hypothetical protein
MNKIEEIFKSWAISASPDQEQSKLAADRIQICDTCENKKEEPYVHCGLCFCALKAKIFSPVIGACPAGKWNEVDKKHLIPNQ